MTDETVLVTGGAGFVGAAVTVDLVARGYRVKVLDDFRRGSPRRLRAVEDDVEVVRADIRDPQAVRTAARGTDCIVHLAYVNGTRFFYEEPELVLDVGVRGMLNVVDACRAEGIGRLLVASSSEVYQDPPSVPTDEEVRLIVPDVHNPRYSYGGGKILSELIAINYGRTGFDQVVVFRPHNIYGPDMGWEHVIPEFCRRLVRTAHTTSDRPVHFNIQGDGSQTRSFMHVRDCSRAVGLLLERGEHLGVYNVGNPEEVTIGELAMRVASVLQVEIELAPGKLPQGSTERRSPDIGRIRRLGFEPEIALAQGLPETVQWYVSQISADHSSEELL